MIPRFHLFEIHELPWVPRFIRERFCCELAAVQRIVRPHQGSVSALVELIRRTEASEVLDVCSGSGVAFAEFIRDAGLAGGSVRCLASDLFGLAPNATLRAVGVDAVGTPVDATKLADAPRATSGARVVTMLNALHHFREAQVIAILKETERAADGAIFLESTSRAFLPLLLTLFVFPASVLMGLFKLPVSLGAILCTLVPIHPFVTTFDSFVSNLRSYSAHEMEALAQRATSGDWVWEVKTSPIGRLGVLYSTALVGYRRSADGVR